MKKNITIFVSFVLFLVIWQFASTKTISLFVPSIFDIWNGFVSMIKNGQITNGIVYSFSRITIATVLSSFVSIFLAILVYNIKTCDYIITTFVGFMRYLPVTAFYPLLIMWFGIGEKMKISFLFLATFVYMLPSVLMAFSSVPTNLIETGYSLGMNKFSSTFKIVLPYCLPNILQTFIMMYGIGWTYISVCEQVNAKYGLGFIITISSSRGKTDLVFASILTIIIFSFIFDKFSNFLVKKIFKWKFINVKLDGE